MSARPPHVAGMFYPSAAAACERDVDAALAASAGADRLPPGEPVGGMVPHAGWSFSGPTAGFVYNALTRTQAPFQTFLLFGAVHRWGTTAAAVSAAATWETPLGDAPLDEELGDALAQEGGALVERSEASHKGEHSIEVQVPFVQRLFPQALICPVNVPPTPDAGSVGLAAARACARLGRHAAVLGSSDLTHYGKRFGFAPAGRGARALQWVKEENDRGFIDRVLAFDGEGALAHAAANHSACGAGAAAAALACSRELGATEATLLDHRTSADVLLESEPADFVGYGAILFHKV